MNRLKIEHGVSRIKRAKLQTYIDQTIAEDIGLMAEWTNNEQHYVVNELLRFALAQSDEFQKYKTEHGAKHSRNPNDARPVSPVSRGGPDPLVPKAVPELPNKPSTPATDHTTRT